MVDAVNQEQRIFKFLKFFHRLRVRQEATQLACLSRPCQQDSTHHPARESRLRTGSHEGLASMEMQRDMWTCMIARITDGLAGVQLSDFSRGQQKGRSLPLTIGS